ncbi:MAG: hypothetical protein ACLP0J_04920 [Solirubrobacteraceae bacterium]|jgi:hypothetical protein
MSKRPFSLRSLAISAAASCLLATGAAASASADPSAAASGCSAAAVSQPFLGFGDTNYYTLAPGQAPDYFNGGGWTLSGGARIAPMDMMDGIEGKVMFLPAGGQAVSPPICVDSEYPTARALIASTPGNSVGVTVSYPGLLPIFPRVAFSGAIGSSAEVWQLSSPLQVHPGNLPGWQLVRFTFTDTAVGVNTDSLIYDFYIDPRMSD